MSDLPTTVVQLKSIQNQLDEAADVLGAPQYFNGFTAGFSGSDFTFLLKIDATPVACFKASFTVAKTLAHDLKIMIERFEAATDHKIMTTKEVLDKLNPQISSPAESKDTPSNDVP